MKSSKKSLNIQIGKIAKLANLTLTKKEEGLFKTQLGNVVGYINKLQDLDTKKIEPIGHITGLKNITRIDKATPSLSQDDALANASRKHNGFFQVDAIIKEE